jgi:hypothetical protein
MPSLDALGKMLYYTRRTGKNAVSTGSVFCLSVSDCLIGFLRQVAIHSYSEIARDTFSSGGGVLDV